MICVFEIKGCEDIANALKLLYFGNSLFHFVLSRIGDTFHKEKEQGMLCTGGMDLSIR